MFIVGDIIQSLHFPETVELKRFEQLGDELYIVEALGRQCRRYYELVLEQEEVATFERLNAAERDNGAASAKMIQHFLQYYALLSEETYPGKRALGGKGLIPLPHQIDAAYNRMLQMPKARMLLADDPGVGKTIIAGIGHH